MGGENDTRRKTKGFTSETGRAVAYRDLVGYYLLNEVFLDVFGNGKH